jgi:2-polyprenyl-3-methyl-5-hydroxy-6-metoxy-1,4-benzoquinol methylase
MYSSFTHLTDDQWLKTIEKSLSEDVINGVKFPGFPDSSSQILFTSLEKEAALKEASVFYQITKSSLNNYYLKKPLKDLKYLDFGCGWGRITRFWIKDIEPTNISGVDITPEILEVCKKIMTVGNYDLCTPYGKLTKEKEIFDFVTAFSVFSHLSEKNGLHWISEIHSSLKPGGLFVLTTLSSSFLDSSLACAENPERSDWHRHIAESVEISYPQWKTQFKQSFVKRIASKILRKLFGINLSFNPLNALNDEIYYLSTGGGFRNMPDKDYGWAMLSRQYIENKWGNLFEVLEFVDNEKILPQAYIILKKI